MEVRPFSANLFDELLEGGGVAVIVQGQCFESVETQLVVPVVAEGVALRSRISSMRGCWRLDPDIWLLMVRP